MKIDRFVRVMLVLMVTLFVWNCAKDIKSPVEAAVPLSFLQVGKSYTGRCPVPPTYAVSFKVLEVQNNGWAKVQLLPIPGFSLQKGDVWFNPNDCTMIAATE
jgi:hypothetical protein